jgi:3-methyladenine DNA glycosylase AlkC
MAEPLKNQFGLDVPEAIARMITAVHKPFARKAFLQDVAQGYDALELMPRGRHIARSLQRHLPASYPDAVDVLLASMAQPSGRAEGGGLASFLFMPHSFFVAEFGLDHFEESMRAHHVITQRFTAEFAIRPFLERHPQATLERLAQWATDPSEHVRRLVSEGTRPRLPWAARLTAFQADPAPVLALLELLRDDPSLYVRRSVANNLNDIGKDHPELLADTARRWLRGAKAERDWVVRHALRWAVKQGAPWALEVLGFGHAGRVTLQDVDIAPRQARIGTSVRIAFDLHNPTAQPQDLLVDLQVHYIKASGAAHPKVFKLKTIALGPGQQARLSRKLSLAEMTTRRHQPGQHRVEVLVNGKAHPLGSFELLPAAAGS